METHPVISCEDIIFRPHPLGYAAALAGLAGLGVACLTLAARHHPGWLVGVALALALAATLVARYTAGGLIIRGYDLVLRTGIWTTRELSLPIWPWHRIRDTRGNIS